MQTLELDAAMLQKRIKDELINCCFACLTSVLFCFNNWNPLSITIYRLEVSHTKEM